MACCKRDLVDKSLINPSNKNDLVLNAPSLNSLNN